MEGGGGGGGDGSRASSVDFQKALCCGLLESVVYLGPLCTQPGALVPFPEKQEKS